MSERAAFLAAIRAEPDDDTRRLAFADWLQEHGDEARAEFIRVQCELALMPPKHRQLFVTDGAGARMEGLGVGLIRHGNGHYSASTGERGLSTATFTEGERVDIYAELGGEKGPRWLRGLRYVKHIEDRESIIFRKDAQSGPWAGAALADREQDLLAFDWCPVAIARTSRRIRPDPPAIQLLDGDGLRATYEFRRGFVGSITCPAADWVANADAILAEHPVRRVALTTDPQFAGEAYGSVWLPGDPQRKAIPLSALVAVGDDIRERAEAVLSLRWPGVEFTLPTSEAHHAP